MRFLPLLLLAAALWAAPARALEPAAQEELTQLMQKVSEEVVEGKADTLLTHAHPALIAKLGGEEKARMLLPGLMQRDLATLAKMGFTKVQFTPGAPVQEKTGGEWTFVLIPAVMVAEGAAGKATMKSHTLACRQTGAGHEWKLLRMNMPEKSLRLLLPELPADFVIPPPENPVIETAAPATP